MIQLSRCFITNCLEKALCVTDNPPWMLYCYFGGQETPCPWTTLKFITLFTKSDCWILKTNHQRTANSPSWEATNHSTFYSFRIPVTVFPWFSLWTLLTEMNALHIFIPYLYTCLISPSISTWVSQMASFLHNFQTTDSRKNPIRERTPCRLSAVAYFACPIVVTYRKNYCMENWKNYCMENSMEDDL
jgi:hypothetical protein